MLRILIFSFFAAQLLAQQAQVTLSGTVTNSKTGEPVAHALVQVRRIGGQLANDPPVSHSAFTDAGGAFQIGELPPGQYSVNASKPGFMVQMTSGRPSFPTVNLTASTGNVLVTLAPLGVVTGKIVDQDGLPLIGVSVVALRAQTVDGFVQVHPDRTATTDDRGMFRLWNLSPAKYYVKASLAQTGDEAFAPVYFGGAHALDTATPVEIGQGGDAKTDLTVSVESAWKIHGFVRNFVPRRPFRFELLNGLDDVTTAHATVNTDTGRFEVSGVVRGSWVLRATQDSSSGEVPVNVAAADLDGVEISLTPPVDIPVAVRFTDAPAVTHPGDDDAETPGNCNVSLQSAGKLVDERAAAFKSARRTNTGMVISGVSPGQYALWFSVSEPGYVPSCQAHTIWQPIQWFASTPAHRRRPSRSSPLMAAAG
jgi:hypothetical protein